MNQSTVNSENLSWNRLAESFSYEQKVENNNTVDLITLLDGEAEIILKNFDFSGELHIKNTKCKRLVLYSIKARKIFIENLEVESLDFEEVECDLFELTKLKTRNFKAHFITSKDINILNSEVTYFKFFDVVSPTISINLDINKNSIIRDIQSDSIHFELKSRHMKCFQVWNLNSKDGRFNLPNTVDSLKMYGYIKGDCYFGQYDSSEQKNYYAKWLINNIELYSNVNGDVQFQNFMTHHFIFYFSNSSRGSIDFHGVSPFANSSQVTITSNRLENIKFYACDFESFNLKSSKISENTFNNCISHGTSWPKYRPYNSEHHLNNNEYLNGKKYYYDSLSIMCELSGDLFGKYNYAYLAKNAELELVSYNSKGWTSHGLDYIPLVLSKILSRYNTSWGLVLLWLIMFNLGYWSFLNFSLHDVITAFNPIHKLESLNYVKNSKILGSQFYIINFLMRLMNSFLVFKFVKSFKKYY